MQTELLAAVEKEAAETAGLRRIQTDDLSIERKGAPGAFVYVGECGRLSTRTLKRIAELAIPPAWSEVRIADDAMAHLQAVGRDDKGRLQYIYHEAWDDVRSATKLLKLRQLGKCLPRLRQAIAEDLRETNPCLGLAAAARLVDCLYLRAGHEGYAGEEGGRGVATLLKRHVRIEGSSITLRFRGKGGKLICRSCDDEALAAALSTLRAIRGERLFKVTTDGMVRPLTAGHLNKYLAEKAGKPITAKDFRTFFASSTALDLLRGQQANTDRSRRSAIMAAARAIAAELANTPTVTRNSYIHPSIIAAFESGVLNRLSPRRRGGLNRAESILMSFLSKCAPAQ